MFVVKLWLYKWQLLGQKYNAKKKTLLQFMSAFDRKYTTYLSTLEYHVNANNSVPWYYCHYNVPTLTTGGQGFPNPSYLSKFLITKQ